MPVVPWEGPPPPGAGAPDKLRNFYHAFSVGLNVATTTKKVVNFLGRKAHPQRKKCTSRENPGYAKKAPALRWYGAPRMVNPALKLIAVVSTEKKQLQIPVGKWNKKTKEEKKEQCTNRVSAFTTHTTKPVMKTDRRTDGRTDGRTSERTEWFLTIARSNVAR